MSYDMFYHASDIKDLTEVLPLSKAKGSDENVCYFTHIKNYALVYLRDKEINHTSCDVTENEMLVFQEWFPGLLEKVYKGRSGYIYSCKNNGNITIAQNWRIWSSTQPVPVAEAEYIEDVYEEILKLVNSGEAQIVRYESYSDEEKRDIIVGVRDYALEKGWLNIDTPQTRFFAEHYPQAWEEAKIYVETMQPK